MLRLSAAPGPGVPPPLQAVLIRAGPLQLLGVSIRISETPDPTAGVLCKSNVTFDPSMGKIIVCERLNTASAAPPQLPLWAPAARPSGVLGRHDSHPACVLPAFIRFSP